jgi:hypothetical protein
METNKVQTLFKIADMPSQKIGDDEKQARIQLENEFIILDIDDIEDCERVIPFQEEIKDLLGSLTNKDALEELQAQISEIANQAKQRQIYRNRPGKVKQFNQSIEAIITKIIELIKDIEEDARTAYVILTQKYFSKTAKEFNLDEKILEEIRMKLLQGLSFIFAGLVVEAGGIGIYVILSKAAETLSIGSRFGPAGILIAGLLLFGMGAYTLYQRNQLQKKHPKLVEFYEEMKKLKKKPEV